MPAKLDEQFQLINKYIEPFTEMNRRIFKIASIVLLLGCCLYSCGHKEIKAVDEATELPPIPPLYTDADTIHYGPAPYYSDYDANGDWDYEAKPVSIPLKNLPIRDMSLEQIFRLYGRPYFKKDNYWPGPDSCYSDNRVRILRQHYPNAPAYEFVFSMNDGSDDDLMLFVFVADGELKIMDGSRYNRMLDFGLED